MHTFFSERIAKQAAEVGLKIAGQSGKRNVSTCKICAWRAVTIDLDAGVTPFLIACEGVCQRFGLRAGFLAYPAGLAQSHCYNVNQSLDPSHEWYRPDVEEIAVAKSGLFLRRIKTPGAAP